MRIQLHFAGSFWYIVLYNDDAAARNGVEQPVEFYNFRLNGFVGQSDLCSRFKSWRLAHSVARRLSREAR